MKLLIFILVLLLSSFFISSVSGVEFGVSPDELTFDDNVDENCQNIKIISEDRTFEIEDKWNTISNSRSPVFYVDNAVNAGVVVRYPKEVIVNNPGKDVEICLKSVKKGSKHGLLIIESDSLSLGVRIEVKGIEIVKNSGNGSLLNKITGEIVNDNAGNDFKSGFSLINLFILSDFVLFGVFLVLVYRYYGKKKGKGRR